MTQKTKAELKADFQSVDPQDWQNNFIDSVPIEDEPDSFEIGEFSNTAGSGFDLADETAALRVYADDGGTAQAGNMRASMDRVLLTIDNSLAASYRGYIGQVKLLAGVDLSSTNSVLAGLMGYLEFAGDSTQNGQVAAGEFTVETAGDITVGASGWLCGVAARLNAASGKSVGARSSGVYVNTTGAAGDKWPYGVYVGGSDVGLYLAACTTAAINIAGDQAIGILYDVDAAATDGLKFNIDSSMTLTRGIYFTGSGACTTAINIDADGTTALNVGSKFTGTDMIVLGGTATGYGIEISGTCTTADILLQNGATINNNAAGSLTVTEDSITLVAAGNGKLIFGGVTDWGTGSTGTLIDGSGWDWVSQTVGHVDDNLNNTAAAAAYHALTIGANQTGDNSAFGTWTELYFKNSVDLSGSDNYAAVWGQVEAGTGFETQSDTDTFLAGGYFNIKTGASCTTNANSVVNGVRVQSEIASNGISHGGRLSALECLTMSGSYQAWDYGLYLVDAAATTGIAIGTCTTGMVITGATGYAVDIQTSGQFRMGIQGTGIPTATATPFAMEIHSETSEALTAGATGRSCGIRSRYEISVAQPNQISLSAVEARLRIKAAIADGEHSGISGSIESDGAIVYTGTSTTQWSAGHFCIELGASCVFTGASGFLTGVTIDSSINATQTDIANITYPALRIKTSSGKLAWQYGIYIDTAAAATGIYIDPGCTYGIQIGAAASAAGSGLTVNTTAPVGFYFDDGGVATAAWAEAMTVGLVLPTASTGAAGSGWPCVGHFYTDQRANLTGAASHNMCALNAGYLIRNNATLDGFDNFAVSAFNPNVNIDSGSALASGTTLACISFSGNWPGTVSGKIVPLHVATTNYNFSAFAQFAEANGCYQDAAAGSGGHKYLKVYLGNTLYTIDMVTA